MKLKIYYIISSQSLKMSQCNQARYNITAAILSQKYRTTTKHSIGDRFMLPYQPSRGHFLPYFIPCVLFFFLIGGGWFHSSEFFGSSLPPFSFTEDQLTLWLGKPVIRGSPAQHCCSRVLRKLCQSTSWAGLPPAARMPQNPFCLSFILSLLFSPVSHLALNRDEILSRPLLNSSTDKGYP